MRSVAVALVVAAVAAAGAGAQVHAAKRPWLWQCEQIGLQTAKDSCYERMLLQYIDRSGNPATVLPRIDHLAKSAGTSLYGNCHMYMHVVGRAWARQHHLTLERLQDVEPRSNDPGCSAGFGMGLVMELGPQIISTGGRSALKVCDRLPTRMRQFTCVHSLGHALMRGYHEALWLAVNACARLGPKAAPDCEQGAFHDYWIALRGADQSTIPVHAVSSPRKLCAEPDYRRWAVECWYRYWIEKVPGPLLQTAAQVRGVCAGLRGAQRFGCIAGAAKDVNEPVAAQAALCAHMRSAADALACVRGVADQADAHEPKRELALFSACARLAKGARAGCAEWFGQTFNVLENGHFVPRCRELASAELRFACVTGAHRWLQPLVTFA